MFQAVLVALVYFSLFYSFKACSGSFPFFYKRQLHRTFRIAKLLKMNFILDFFTKGTTFFYKVGKLFRITKWGKWY